METKKPLPKHEGWKGLHGPVTYVGQTLYTDDREVMRCYWTGFCAGVEAGHFVEFLEKFPGLDTREASRIMRETAPGQEFEEGSFVYVFIDGELNGWHITETNAPYFMDLRGPKGKATALDFLKKIAAATQEG